VVCQNLYKKDFNSSQQLSAQNTAKPKPSTKQYEPEERILREGQRRVAIENPGSAEVSCAKTLG